MTAGVPDAPGPAAAPGRLSATHTGDAGAVDGGRAVTGIRISDDLTTVQVSSTGDAHSEGPGTAVSGVLIEHHHPLAPTPYQVRSSLPADTAVFTGRRAEVEGITELVERATASGGVVTIQGGVQAIDGMPGIGKTALAVHVAHRVKDRFPDRQLFIDLHGHTPAADPVAVFDALGGLLAATGMDARYLPATVEERVWRWRDRMSGEKTLLVLDNARSSAQVSPLLPGAPGCLVLVTSRHYLGDLDTGAQPITLHALSPAEARTLFRRLAPRAAADPDPAVDEVVGLAGGLPLAITLVARVYANHATWTLRSLSAWIGDRLLTRHAEEATIAAAFELSYATLTDPQQRLFTLLGVHPGTEIDDYAAAALAGIPRRDAEEILEGLYSARLLTEPSEQSPGRYGMHDLVRAYIRDRAATTLPAAGRDQAMGRVLNYYEHTAARADTFLTRHIRPAPAGPGTTPAPAAPPSAPALPDHAQAQAWARTERANLLACLNHAAAAAHQHPRIVALTAALAGLLRQDGPWTDAVTRHTTAARAARQVGDRLSQANAFNDLGIVRRVTGDNAQAGDLLEQALILYRDLGDRLGQANALNDLGIVRRLTGDYAQAGDLLEQALILYRDLGDRLGQANALNALGIVRRLTGDYAQAGDLLEQALILYRDLGDRLGQANALKELGSVRYSTGDNYPHAGDLLEQALILYRDLGDRLGQANALNDLGNVRRLTGDNTQAGDLLEQALTQYCDLGNRLGEANALKDLGNVRRLTGDNTQAGDLLEQALTLYCDLGNRLGEANALKDLGNVRRLTGDNTQAGDLFEQALTLYRDIGNRGGEVELLNDLGALCRVRGDLDRSAAHHQESLVVSREIGSAWDEANAQAGLARCALAAGHVAEARTGLRQAWEIFQRIGTAEVTDMAAELRALDPRPGDGVTAEKD